MDNNENMDLHAGTKELVSFLREEYQRVAGVAPSEMSELVGKPLSYEIENPDSDAKIVFAIGAVSQKGILIVAFQNADSCSLGIKTNPYVTGYLGNSQTPLSDKAKEIITGTIKERLGL